ncbi:MAG: penicillin-binding protein 2 [Alphaproteobacteria bacterium]|nr:penicillin-binding protein 2 [Alphaproteobacteria bacterium]
MKPHARVEPNAESAEGRAVEAAPARGAIRMLALCLFAAFLLLGGRAVQLALREDPLGASAAAAQPAPDIVIRADLTDRNGALLATDISGYALTAQPARVWNPRETAQRLRTLFPDLEEAALLRRLTERNRALVYLRRGLTPPQRAAVLDLGLAGIGFEEEERRVYPNGALAGHVLGFADRDLNALAGVERGLDARIRAAGETGARVRLSLDVRVQHAVEQELARAGRATRAKGGAAVVLDARTGETLALASWPALDPNFPGAASDAVRLNRAAAARFEMGSTIKPFTVAIALEERLTRPRERFDVVTPYAVSGRPIRDLHPFDAPLSLAEVLAESSNVGAAQIALRIGAARQRDYFARLGLLRASPIELPESAAPIAPMRGDPLSVAVLGYGHGMANSLISVAEAYTVFANDGARVAPTLLARDPGDAAPRTPVFSPETTHVLIGMLRGAVTHGTGEHADVPGLEIAGKTGSAEKPGAAGYDPDRMLSSFAAVFPASNPRYVIVLALDEPARTEAAGGQATGGATAAPPVGRIAARIAPLLGLRVEPRRSAQDAPGGDDL